MPTLLSFVSAKPAKILHSSLFTLHSSFYRHALRQVSWHIDIIPQPDGDL